MNNLPFEKIKRKILIKKEETEQKPIERSIKELIQYGIININKQSGPTSHQVSDYVQRILEIKKSGHSGTLDPKVTGSLPIALNKATRIVQTLLKSGKEYIALMHLHKKIPQSQIQKSAKELVGKITQLPPIRSAVKRVEREREIYYMEILEIKDQDVLFKVGCEAGTYIRKLIHDWGLTLKTNAHMSQLIRTKAGPFNIENSHTLHDLKDAYEYYKEGKETLIKKIIQPIEAAIQHLPKVWIQEKAIKALSHGTDLFIPGITQLESHIEKNDTVAILSQKSQLIALGTAQLTSEEILNQEKGTAVKTKKIFIDSQ